MRKTFNRIKKLRSQAGYADGGNCCETSIALGIQLARKGITATLVEGNVRGIKHFWLETSAGRLDPTKNQFPGLRDDEYPKPKHTGFDFEEMVVLLELDPISQ